MTTWRRQWQKLAMPYAMALRRGDACTISEYWKNTPELPDVSSRLVERRPPPATLHGVVFDILAARPCDGPLAGERGRSVARRYHFSSRISARGGWPNNSFTEAGSSWSMPSNCSE